MFIVGLFVLSSVGLVAGSTVTLAPRASITNPGVTLKDKFGYVNATQTETFNAFTVYANGTVFFDVSGTTGTMQGTYMFLVNSYGNGTLVLRFAGPIPQSVTANPATSSFDPKANWQQITYTANQNSVLIIVYAPILNFGVVNGSIFYQLIVVASGIMYASMFFGIIVGRLEKDKTKVPFFASPAMIILTGAIGTIGFLFILIVGANLVKPACPVGYTCVG